MLDRFCQLKLRRVGIAHETNNDGANIFDRTLTYRNNASIILFENGLNSAGAIEC